MRGGFATSWVEKSPSIPRFQRACSARPVRDIGSRARRTEPAPAQPAFGIFTFSPFGAFFICFFVNGRSTHFFFENSFVMFA